VRGVRTRILTLARVDLLANTRTPRNVVVEVLAAFAVEASSVVVALAPPVNHPRPAKQDIQTNQQLLSLHKPRLSKRDESLDYGYEDGQFFLSAHLVVILNTVSHLSYAVPVWSI
jgi:hypothetical protein